MTTIDEPIFTPEWGEEVEWTRGLCVCTGTVDHLYGGSCGRAIRVVVLEPSGDPWDPPSLLSMFLEEVRPAASAESAWAQAWRYRETVQAALGRVAGGEVEEVLLDAFRADRAIAVTMPDGVTVGVGTQFEPAPPNRTTARVLRRLRTDWTYGPALLVTNGEVPASLRGNVVRWRTKRDDNALRNAVARAAATAQQRVG
jgi:hypothetical protein